MTYVEAVGAVQQRSFDALKVAQSTQVASLRATSDLTEALLALQIPMLSMPTLVRAISDLTAFSFALVEQQVAYSKQLADAFGLSIAATGPAALASAAPPVALAAATPPIALAAPKTPVALAAPMRPIALAAPMPSIALAAPNIVTPLAPGEAIAAREAAPPAVEVQPEPLEGHAASYVDLATPLPATAGEAPVAPALSEDIVLARSIELPDEPQRDDDSPMHVAPSANETSATPPPALSAEYGSADRTVETLGTATSSPPVRESLTDEIPSKTFARETETPPSFTSAATPESAPPKPPKMPSVSNNRSTQRRNPRRK